MSKLAAGVRLQRFDDAILALVPAEKREVARLLLRMGGGDRGNPEVRRDDQVAAGIPDPVPLPRHRKPPG